MEEIEAMLKPTKMKRDLFVTITVTAISVSLFLGILLFWQVEYLEVSTSLFAYPVANQEESLLLVLLYMLIV